MREEKQYTEQLRLQAAILLSQARAQSLDIRRVLGSLSSDSALYSRLAAAAAHLSDVASSLSDALGSASFPLRGTDLMALDAAVNSGEASSLVAEATAQAGTEAAKAAAMVTTASVETRQEVQRTASDLFDRKIFDPYLHFANAEDEAEFRKRQADAKAYVDAQLALHTPEGNLNAGGGTIGGMLDAHAHGAGDSPEFMPRWNQLVTTTGRQHDAMHAAGQSTAEYDGNVTASVRRFLKDEGHLSEAEIDRRLAAVTDPLDAVKPFLTGDHASRSMVDTLDLNNNVPSASFQSLSRTEASTAASVRDAHMGIDISAMAAKLKAAGIPSAEPADADPAHGLSIQKPASKTLPVVGG